MMTTLNFNPKTELQKKAERSLLFEAQTYELLEGTLHQQQYTDEQIVSRIMYFDEEQELWLHNIYAHLVAQFYTHDSAHVSQYARDLVVTLRTVGRKYQELLQRYEAVCPDSYKETIICLKLRIKNLRRYCIWLRKPVPPVLALRYKRVRHAQTH